MLTVMVLAVDGDGDGDVDSGGGGNNAQEVAVRLTFDCPHAFALNVEPFAYQPFFPTIRLRLPPNLLPCTCGLHRVPFFLVVEWVRATPLGAIGGARTSFSTQATRRCVGTIVRQHRLQRMETDGRRGVVQAE